MTHLITELFHKECGHTRTARLSFEIHKGEQNPLTALFQSHRLATDQRPKQIYRTRSFFNLTHRKETHNFEPVLNSGSCTSLKQ